MNEKFSLKTVLRDTIPVMTGYIVLGMGFGLILKSTGYGVIWAFLMSLFVFAGSMQYVAVGLLSAGAGMMTFFLTTLMVNVRHLFYGLSMVEKYKDVGRTKPYLMFALTDETYALVCGDCHGLKGKERTKYCFFVSLFDQIYWVSGSVIGSAIGSVLHFNTKGIEFTLTALFLTIFTGQWLDTKDHRSAVIGVVSSAICLILSGADSFLIPSMILIAVSMFIMKRSDDSIACSKSVETRRDDPKTDDEPVKSGSNPGQISEGIPECTGNMKEERHG